MGSVHAWYTLLLFVAFVGIVVWAYSKRRRKDFDEAARLPFADENPTRPGAGDTDTDTDTDTHAHARGARTDSEKEEQR